MVRDTGIRDQRVHWRRGALKSAKDLNEQRPRLGDNKALGEARVPAVALGAQFRLVERTPRALGREAFQDPLNAGTGASGPPGPLWISITDFKTAAEQGIETGQIKSIIHPALADHVRREAVRFRDELLRAP